MLASSKNKHLGETAYVFGSGPSLLKFIPYIDKYPGIYIGANQVYFSPEIKNKLNYLVTEMYQPEIESMVNTTIYHCNVITPLFKSHPQRFTYKRDLLSICNKMGFSRNGFFGGVSSTIFHLVIIAIHFGCKKIYLVGCDCTEEPPFYRWKASHLETATTNQKAYISQGKRGAYETLVKGWEIIRDVLNTKYKDVEIISINPAALKNVFPGEYTP